MKKIWLVFIPILIIIAVILIYFLFLSSPNPYPRSITSLNDKTIMVLHELLNKKTIFGDSQDVVFLVGPEGMVKISRGTEHFNIALGAKTLDNSAIGNRSRLQYKISIISSSNQCANESMLGFEKTSSLFITPINRWVFFDLFEGSEAFALIELTIPKGTLACTQKVLVEVKDNERNYEIGMGLVIVKIV